MKTYINNWSLYSLFFNLPILFLAYDFGNLKPQPMLLAPLVLELEEDYLVLFIPNYKDALSLWWWLGRVTISSGEISTRLLLTRSWIGYGNLRLKRRSNAAHWCQGVSNSRWLQQLGPVQVRKITGEGGWRRQLSIVVTQNSPFV